MRISLRPFILGSLFLAAALIFYGGSDESPTTSSPELAPSPTRPAVAAAPRAPARAPEAAPSTAPPSDGASERMALLRSDPVLLDRAEQHQRAPAADARWSDAVDEGRYTADDVDPAVREAFSTVELEPRYDEGGMIEGLTIRSMQPDHPFALAGLREGDRLSRIHGVELRDPAELPSLFARLGPVFELCTDEGGARAACVDVALD